MSDHNLDIEDEVHDWKHLSSCGAGVPKRGSKQISPDGSQVQLEMLKLSREAMYDALSGVRGHHIKQVLWCVWYNGRALVPHPRGSYFRDIGFPLRGGMLVLNALECIYLVERGSMIAYRANADWEPCFSGMAPPYEHTKLPKMDLAYLYGLAFQELDLSINEYLVYSYLKRLGYLIQYYNAPNEAKLRQKTCTPQQIVSPRSLSDLAKYIRIRLAGAGILSFPALHSGHFATKHYFDYTSVYTALQIIPTSSVASHAQQPEDDYSILFKVWKPTQSFSKKNPGDPHFHICVTGCDQSFFPSLSTLRELWSQVGTDRASGNVDIRSPPKPGYPAPKSGQPPTKRDTRLKRQLERQAKLPESVQRRNLYLKSRDDHLRMGVPNTNIVIATVMDGIINLITVSKGDFSLKQCPELDAIEPMQSQIHGLMWMD